ncbi:cupin domain-containing protein [Crenobacter cavernae]|uniref:Cupin n=1 Tax=Crenobacter cavernae TaxID=2290923 RepID=A0A345Y2M1_9NEIS|nr:cupin domain-containing protein [Crenobacter cavernae]AXK38173.1 cupin [Crenobacter cavernae]
MAEEHATRAEHKSFDRPDEVREFPLGRLELIKIGGATVGRAVFKPGWRWAESVQPLAKTKSCEAPHFQYHVSGVLLVKMDDGTELICRPGDVSLLPSGHDAWVVGDEAAVVVDFQGMIDYARAS